MHRGFSAAASRRAPVAVAGLLITALAVGPAGSAAATGTDVDVTAAAPKYFSSGNYQNNAAHTGLAPGSSLPTALKRLWKKDFQGSVSYPLVVGNRIFVTAVPADNTAGTVHAFAFDKRTGRQLWKPVAIGDQGDQNSLAYGSGRLVVLNGVGRLRHSTRPPARCCGPGACPMRCTRHGRSMPTSR